MNNVNITTILLIISSIVFVGLLLFSYYPVDAVKISDPTSTYEKQEHGISILGEIEVENTAWLPRKEEILTYYVCDEKNQSYTFSIDEVSRDRGLLFQDGRQYLEISGRSSQTLNLNANVRRFNETPIKELLVYTTHRSYSTPSDCREVDPADNIGQIIIE